MSTNRALVIKYGNPEFASAIESALVVNTSQVPDTALRFFNSDTKKEIHAAMGFKNWRELYYGIYDRYGFPDEYHKPNIIMSSLLIGWSVIWMEIFECYRKLSEWNRK